MIDDCGYWRVSKPEIWEFSILSLKYKYFKVTPEIIIANDNIYSIVMMPPT